jgi:hypothetical protein
MKKFFLKPGFEFIFSLSLIVVLGLPPVLLAQNQKDVEIKIVNGDTTVNGKNIKELSAADRQNALRDIKHINSDAGPAAYSFKRQDSTGGKAERLEFRKRMENGAHQPMITEHVVVRDSLGNIVEVKSGHRRTFANRPGFGERNFDGGPGPGMRSFERRVSQSFDYVNTDNEGISTRLRFRVTEISNEDLKKMPHVEGGKFEISDLNLVPEFSTGKTLLMFNLPEKGLADVKLIDSEGKVLWKEKSTDGKFTNSFAMGLNGVYYLQIKQGNNIAIKRIVKEE